MVFPSETSTFPNIAGKFRQPIILPETDLEKSKGNEHKTTWKTSRVWSSPFSFHIFSSSYFHLLWCHFSSGISLSQGWTSWATEFARKTRLKKKLYLTYFPFLVKLIQKLLCTTVKNFDASTLSHVWWRWIIEIKRKRVEKFPRQNLSSFCWLLLLA